MRTVAVANQKGGCGKTTVTINLAACLAREGRRTLIVDLDPQGHCALGLAVPEEQLETSIADVLLACERENVPDLSRVAWQISSNFDLIPSRFDLSRLEQALAGVEDREKCLRRVLDTVADSYDFVLIDTPPTVGFLTETALYAADEIIVPVDTGYFSLHGLAKQLDTIGALRATAGRRVVVRILANLYDVRTKLAREILAELRKRHADAMFSSFINFNTKLKESCSLGQPISEYDPASAGCRDFVHFARELISFGEPPAVVEDAAQPEQVEPVTETVLQQADALAANADKLLATSQALLGTGRRIPAEAPIPTPAEIDRRVAEVYGAQPVEDGILFAIKAENARSVRLAGDFNDWNPDRTPLLRRPDGAYWVKLPLAPGRYRYRYVIDGRWQTDPGNATLEANPFGEFNSVVEVKT